MPSSLKNRRKRHQTRAPTMTAGRWNLFVVLHFDLVWFIPIHRYSGHVSRLSWCFRELWDTLSQEQSTEVIMSVFDKLPGQSSDGERREWWDEGLCKEYPLVAEMLLTTELHGKPHKSASLSLWLDPQEGFKGCLNEREGGYVLFATSDTLMGVFGSLEALLELPQPPWRKVVAQQRHSTTRRKL